MLPHLLFVSRQTKPKTVPGHLVLDEEYEWVFGLKDEDVKDDPENQEIAENHPFDPAGKRGARGAYGRLGLDRGR